MFRRTAPVPSTPPPTTERRYQLNLIPECKLTISSGPERRKHLALIGDVNWTNYWFLDALAQSAPANLPSFIVSGPADTQLRNMPHALGLPEHLSVVRNILPYAIDPSSFRDRVNSFNQVTSVDNLTLVMMGRDLKHIWPFLLGKKGDFQNKLLFLIADVTSSLKLPLSHSFRYFLVQESHQEQFEKAVERWHRHDTDKPRFLPLPVHRQKCTLYEVQDPL